MAVIYKVGRLSRLTSIISAVYWRKIKSLALSSSSSPAQVTRKVAVLVCTFVHTVYVSNIMLVIAFFLLAAFPSFPILPGSSPTITTPGTGPHLPVHASLLFTQLEPLINMPFRKWRPWSKEPFISIRQAFVGLLATRVLGSLGYQPDAALPIMPACAAYRSTEVFPPFREKILFSRLPHTKTRPPCRRECVEEAWMAWQP